MNAGILRAIYDLGLGRQTGAVRLRGPLGDGEVVHVHAGAVGARAARETLVRWPDAHGHVRFEPTPSAPIGMPVPLVGWVRRMLAARTTDVDVLRIERTFVRSTLDRSRVRRADLDASDLAILDALAVAPALRDVALRARAPRHAVASFVTFLRTIGALDATPDLPSSPDESPPPAVVVDRRAHALLSLGLDRDAPSSSIRATFRKLARLLHPDMHPLAGEPERRALARRFAEIRAAYEELTVGG